MCHYNNLSISLWSQWHGELIAAARSNGKVFCSQQHDTDGCWKSWLQSLFYCFSQQQWGQVVLNLTAHVALCNLLNRRSTFLLVNGYWQLASVKHYHSRHWPHGDYIWTLQDLHAQGGMRYIRPQIKNTQIHMHAQASKRRCGRGVGNPKNILSKTGSAILTAACVILTFGYFFFFFFFYDLQLS